MTFNPSPSPYGLCPRCHSPLYKSLDGLYCKCGYPDPIVSPTATCEACAKPEIHAVHHDQRRSKYHRCVRKPAASEAAKRAAKRIMRCLGIVKSQWIMEGGWEKQRDQIAAIIDEEFTRNERSKEGDAT